MTQSGGINGANTSFTVKTKSGLTLSMGAATGAMQVPGRSQIWVWAVDRIEDSAGNYITVSYTQDPDTTEHYVTRIDYTGNAAAGLSPYNAVQFHYETRSDTSQRYLGGHEIRTTRRLSKISTHAGAAAVREKGSRGHEGVGVRSCNQKRSRGQVLQSCAKPQEKE